LALAVALPLSAVALSACAGLPSADPDPARIELRRTVALSEPAARPDPTRTLRQHVAASLARQRVALTPPEAASFADHAIGSYALSVGDYATAQEALARVALRERDNPDVIDLAVRAALMAGRGEAALALAAEPFAVSEAEASALGLVRQVAALLDNRPKDALARDGGVTLGTGDSLVVLARDPFDAAVAAALGAWAHLATGDADAGVELSDSRFGALFSELFLYNRGFLLTSLGRDAEARESFARMIEGAWPRPVRMPAALAAYAGLMAEAGETDAALRMLSHQAGLIGQATVLAAPVEALKLGQPVPVPRLTIRQGSAMALYVAATVYSARYGNERVAQYLMLARMLDPELHDVTVTLAEVWAAEGRGSEAITLLGEVPHGSGWYDVARVRIAALHLEAGRRELALQHARALALDATSHDVLMRAAAIMTATGHPNEAEAAYDRILAGGLSPTDQTWRVLWARGGVRERQGRFADAESDLHRALETDPEQPEVLNHLGFLWIDRGMHLEEGFRLIRRAAELKPTAPHIIDSLGWAYYRLGEYARAVHHLERAAELDPDSAEINDHLGDAYWRVGRAVEARFQWRRALQFAAEGANRPGLERKIAEGLTDPLVRSIAGPDPRSTPLGLASAPDTADPLPTRGSDLQ
jgi:tetratricopeptide (TPR) repeat protein